MTTHTEPVEHIAFHPNFMSYGWARALPRQSTAINAILSTASHQNIDGDLDHLVTVTIGHDNNLLFGGLDGPLVWGDPDDHDDADTGPDDLHALSRSHFEHAVAVLGRPQPATMRELVDLLADIGFCTHTRDGEVEQWRIVDDLPGPDELLPFPADVAADYRRMRWHATYEHVEQAILRHLCETLDYPDELSTSLQRLAAAVGHEPDDLRHGLRIMLDEGDFRVVRGDGAQAVDVDPADLAEHARFRLLPDWDKFAENRIVIRRGDTGDQEERQ